MRRVSANDVVRFDFASKKRRAVAVTSTPRNYSWLGRTTTICMQKKRVSLVLANSVPGFRKCITYFPWPSVKPEFSGQYNKPICWFLKKPVSGSKTYPSGSFSSPEARPVPVPPSSRSKASLSLLYTSYTPWLISVLLNSVILSKTFASSALSASVFADDSGVFVFFFSQSPQRAQHGFSRVEIFTKRFLHGRDVDVRYFRVVTHVHRYNFTHSAVVASRGKLPVDFDVFEPRVFFFVRFVFVSDVRTVIIKVSFLSLLLEIERLERGFLVTFFSRELGRIKVLHAVRCTSFRDGKKKVS